MELKQKDKDLLGEFFSSQSDWMYSNSLLDFKNLTEFKQRFLDFLKSKSCEGNLACQLFQSTLEHELLNCKERELRATYKGDQKAKLEDFIIPAPRLETDNPSILLWVNETRIVISISPADISKANKSLDQKLKQNRAQRQKSYEDARNVIFK